MSRERDLGRVLVACLFVLFVLGAASPALAGGGYVRGRFEFFQNQGNFCPLSRDCTGANYLQSEHHTFRPVRDTKVFVRNADTKSILGQGSTNASGDFVVSWFDASHDAPQVEIYWRAEHKDGRYAVRTGSGQVWTFQLNKLPLVNGTTSATPQDVGIAQWGNANLPDDIANVYDGAWMMWTRALSLSNRMVTSFNNVQIRAFSTDCPTSCAVTDDNVIKLDPNAAYSPQSRVMHEMGHIAHARAANGAMRFAVETCYPSRGSSCPWNLGSAEWQSTQFEEGFATFLGDTGLYRQSALKPFTCFASATACTSGDEERSTLSVGSTCATDEYRRPISLIRYLWDMYDDQADTPAHRCNGDICFDLIDDLHLPLSKFIDIVHAYPLGNCGDHYSNGPFCWHNLGTSLEVDYPDERSGEDFKYNANQAFGIQSWGAGGMNCDP